MTDIRSHNRHAWNQQVGKGNRWTVPVSADEVARAKRGELSLLLTPTIPVPADWFPPLAGRDVLCLASGGGQQGPLLAAAGANVTVFDNSPAQLAQDRLVADREELALTTVEGDMADLSSFADQSFDLIFHPVSNCFVPDVRPVWREAYRVLRPNGTLLAGFCNETIYLFDLELYDQGQLQVKHALPYSDLTSLSAAEQERYLQADTPLEFGHTLDDQIGGQIDAGFALIGFYQDRDPNELLSRYIAGFVATRAIKLPPAGQEPT